MISTDNTKNNNEWPHAHYPGKSVSSSLQHKIFLCTCCVQLLPPPPFQREAYFKCSSTHTTYEKLPNRSDFFV